MAAIPVRGLRTNGANVPLLQVSDVGAPIVTPEPGAQRFRHAYPGGRMLDALLVNRGSRTLVVSFHGALDRKLFSIPRFERLRSLTKYRVNSLYFSDPSLHIDPSLELSWFTGWKNVNVHRDIAAWIAQSAEALGSERIVLTGSSGGGFAALMVGSYLPESVVIAYSPQVDIRLYEADGKYPHAAKRAYIKHVWPELTHGQDIAKFDFSTKWNEPIVERTSAVARYSQPRDTQILFVSNTRDTHHHQVHLPALQDALDNNPSRFQVLTYVGAEGHHPPGPLEFERGLARASQWAGFDIPAAAGCVMSQDIGDHPDH